MKTLTAMVAVTVLALSVTAGVPSRAYGAPSTSLSSTEYEEFLKLIEASKTGKYPEKSKPSIPDPGLPSPGLPIPSSRLQGEIRLDPHLLAINDFELHFRRSATLRGWSLGFLLGSTALAVYMVNSDSELARTALGVAGGGLLISLGCYIFSLVDDFAAADALAGSRPETRQIQPKEHVDW